MTGLCKCCKYVVYCTYKSSGGGHFCEEFEDTRTAAEHEWDLQEFLKLYTAEGTEVDGQAGDQ